MTPLLHYHNVEDNKVSCLQWKIHNLKKKSQTTQQCIQVCANYIIGSIKDIMLRNPCLLHNFQTTMATTSVQCYYLSIDSVVYTHTHISCSLQ